MNDELRPGTPVRTNHDLWLFGDERPAGFEGWVVGIATDVAYTAYTGKFYSVLFPLYGMHDMSDREISVDMSRMPYVKDAVKVRDVKLLDVVERKNGDRMVVDSISIPLGDQDQLIGYVELEGYAPDGIGRHCFEVEELDSMVVVIKPKEV